MMANKSSLTEWRDITYHFLFERHLKEKITGVCRRLTAPGSLPLLAINIHTFGRSYTR